MIKKITLGDLYFERDGLESDKNELKKSLSNIKRNNNTLEIESINKQIVEIEHEIYLKTEEILSAEKFLKPINKTDFKDKKRKKKNKNKVKAA